MRHILRFRVAAVVAALALPAAASAQSGIETAMDVDRRKFRTLVLFVCGEFFALALEVGPFGVCLGTDRDVLTCSHRHGAGDQPGDPCDQNIVAGRMRCCNADHKTRRRYNAVVRTQDRCAQPADASCAVSFAMANRHSLVPY